MQSNKTLGARVIYEALILSLVRGEITNSCKFVDVFRQTCCVCERRQKVNMLAIAVHLIL